MENIVLILSDTRGVYIPRGFVTGNDPAVLDTAHCDKWHISLDLAATLLNDPYTTESFWDIWVQILESAYFIADDGRKYTLYQDGDLFAIAYDNLTSDQYLDFFGEAREE